MNNPYITDIKVNNYGYATDLMKLPVGTCFSVLNGEWEGHIIENTEGKKSVRLFDPPNGLEKDIEITDNNRYSLVLDYLNYSNFDKANNTEKTITKEIVGIPFG